MGMLINPYAHTAVGGGGGPYLCDAIQFGAAGVYKRGAQLTGVADSKLITVSLWIRINAFGGSHNIVGSPAEGGAAGSDGVAGAFMLHIHNTPRNTLRIIGKNPAGTNVLRLNTVSTLVVNTWYHWLISCDLADTAKRHFYINDVNELEVGVYTNDLINFTVNDFSVGAEPDGGNAIASSQLADLWVAPGVYIDFSQSANRRKFISSGLKPVSLGSDGSTPTGTAPRVFLHLDDGEATANFATNRGTGGGLTASGTITTAATSPSD